LLLGGCSGASDGRELSFVGSCEISEEWESDKGSFLTRLENVFIESLQAGVKTTTSVTGLVPVLTTMGH